MSNPLRKSISLGGPQPLRYADLDASGNPIYNQLHTNDYRLLAWNDEDDPFHTSPQRTLNRNMVKASSTWVKVWVNWPEIQGSAPVSRDDSWNALNSGPSGQAWLRRLDRQIKAINDDGRAVILTLYQSFPLWASANNGSPPSKHTSDQHIPDDLSQSGPYAWFLEHLICRYKKGVATNPIGPHAPGAGETDATARYGNPAGATIDALEICNEPNLLYWPQAGLPAKVAQMIETAAGRAATWGWASTGQKILAPAISDVIAKGSSSDDGINATNWQDFTSGVLSKLNTDSFAPTVYVGWSHHNYTDVKSPLSSGSRAQTVQQTVSANSWAASDHRVWLTEGGYRKADTSDLEYSAQNTKVSANFDRMVSTTGIFMWTQHVIMNLLANDTFLSGLGDGWLQPPDSTLEYEGPLWGTWIGKPGSTGP